MSRWRTALIGIVGLALLGCDGYADLPLPLRETATLRVERVERFSEGPGLVQIALDPPTDALGPFVVVGHPSVLSGRAAVLSWAFGTCRGAPEPSDPALRLCIAVVYQHGSQIPPPVSLALVVESRSDARRFTLSGAEASP
jgi:hypothetical protein